MRAFTMLVFASAMALAGFLLFQVQPVMAKFILPWFGGSATTWTVCMLFFQLALLAGYAYVYAVSLPLSVRWQAIVQIGLLLGALAFLPITPSEVYKPTDASNPTGRIMLMLLMCIGVPYAVLSTTSPLLQRWLSHMDPRMATSRFFALSNLGSLLGLLSYPFVFERIWSSPQQTRSWSWGFGLFALLMVAAALLVVRYTRSSDGAAAAPPTPEADDRSAPALWISYAALGSVLLLATTNQITQFMAVIPFLWILPLSLYLLTFIIAFGHQRLYGRLPFAGAFVILALLAVTVAAPGSSASLVVRVVVPSLTMFAGCMICHGEMVRLQPSPRRLPRFYLAIAVGGALGGLLVTLVAPLVFADYFEHQLSLALTGVVSLALTIRTTRHWRRGLALALAAVFVVTAVDAARQIATGEATLVDRIRNFYGVVKVIRDDDSTPTRASRWYRPASNRGRNSWRPTGAICPIAPFGPGPASAALWPPYASDGKAVRTCRFGSARWGSGSACSRRSGSPATRSRSTS